MINLQGSSPTALLNVKGKWSHFDLSQFLIACWWAKWRGYLQAKLKLDECPLFKEYNMVRNVGPKNNVAMYISERKKANQRNGVLLEFNALTVLCPEFMSIVWMALVNNEMS